MTRWRALPHVCIKMSIWRAKPPGSPSSLWEPCCSCGLRADILANMVPKASVSRLADWDCQGWGQQGSCAFILRACTSSSQRLFPSAGWKPKMSWLLGAGMEGQPGPADKRAVHLYSASWIAGAGQTEGTSHSPRSLSLVVYQTFKIVFFPRLIDQSQGSRNVVSSSIGLLLSHRWHPLYSLVRPFFALV